MAGFFDSDFVEWASGMGAFYDRRNQEKSRQQYQGLLDQYGREGPLRPGEPRGYDLEPGFFAQAAGIPGYQSLAGGLQQGQQAMDRQQQAQGTISQYQQAALDQQRAQAERPYSEMTAAQAAQLQQRQVEHGDMLWQQQQEAQRANAPIGAPYFSMNAQQRFDSDTKRTNIDQQVATAVDVLDFLETSTPADRARPGVVPVINAALQGDMINYFRQKYDAGAMQQADLEFFEGLADQSVDIFDLTDAQKNKMRFWTERLKEDRRNLYMNTYGVEAQPARPGYSSFSRSFNQGGRPGPNIQPIAPIAPSLGGGGGY